jgi:hypothetical protein
MTMPYPRERPDRRRWEGNRTGRHLAATTRTPSFMSPPGLTFSSHLEHSVRCPGRQRSHAVRRTGPAPPVLRTYAYSVVIGYRIGR